MKTKVSILEREKEKMSKFVTSSDGIGKVSRIAAYQTRNSEVYLKKYRKKIWLFEISKKSLDKEDNKMILYVLKTKR